MTIIDMHVHAWPDKIAQGAKDHLESLFGEKLVAVPTVANLLRAMDGAGISSAALASVATRPDQVAPINRWLFSLREERIIPFAAMHPEYAGWRDELKRIRDSGGAGIKLQPEFQGFYVDDEKVYRLYEKLEDDRVPVLIHCGAELSGTGKVHASPERVARVHRKFPGIPVIAGHFGGHLMWDEVEKHLSGLDVYLETSCTFPFIRKEQLLSILSRHSPDRILFGSDFPMGDPRPDVDFVEDLSLDPSLKEKLYSVNALRLLNKG